METSNSAAQAAADLVSEQTAGTGAHAYDVWHDAYSYENKEGHTVEVRGHWEKKSWKQLNAMIEGTTRKAANAANEAKRQEAIRKLEAMKNNKSK